MKDLGDSMHVPDDTLMAGTSQLRCLSCNLPMHRMHDRKALPVPVGGLPAVPSTSGTFSKWNDAQSTLGSGTRRYVPTEGRPGGLRSLGGSYTPGLPVVRPRTAGSARGRAHTTLGHSRSHVLV